MPRPGTSSGGHRSSGGHSSSRVGGGHHVGRSSRPTAVSYTHLTLPTILLV